MCLYPSLLLTPFIVCRQWFTVPHVRLGWLHTLQPALPSSSSLVEGRDICIASIVGGLLFFFFFCPFPSSGSSLIHALASLGEKRGNQGDVTFSSNMSKTHRHPFRTMSLFPFEEPPIYLLLQPSDAERVPNVSFFIRCLVLRAVMRNVT